MTKQSKKAAPVTLTDTLSTLPTKSAQIRYLDSLEMPRADIARTLTAYYADKPNPKKMRYQHVRGVLEMPVKNPKK